MPNDEPRDRRSQADHEQQPHRLQTESERQIHPWCRGGDDAYRVEASGAHGEVSRERIDVDESHQAQANRPQKQS